MRKRTEGYPSATYDEPSRARDRDSGASTPRRASSPAPSRDVSACRRRRPRHPASFSQPSHTYPTEAASPTPRLALEAPRFDPVSFNEVDARRTALRSPLSIPHPLPACVSQMLKGGVIMDVVNVEQARIAEEAGAVAVMALERVPADIRKDGGVARMSDPTMIKAIKEAVTIPVMAKARIGHFVEAQILESVGIDYIDESEVLTPADEINHINKHNFKVPVLCGCRDLGEALRRIAEGSSMIRTKGEAGTGNVVEAVRHCRAVMGDIRRLQAMDEDEIFVYAKEIRAPLELVRQTKTLGRLPVVNFAAGGVATPADAAMMMQLGMDGVFVGSGIFKSGEPAKRARAIVQAVTHYNDPKILAEVSQGLGEAMVGIDCKEMHFTSYAARSE